MNNKLYTLVLFQLKRNFLSGYDWLNNAIFLLINITLFAFTITPEPNILHQFFLSVIMTSILLLIVLMSNNVFDEDVHDGSLNQYLLFGVPMYLIYLSKVIAITFQFAFITLVVFPCIGLFYAIEFNILVKIWMIILLSIPLLASIGVFGGILTINLNKNSVISILLVFPLFISSLIILSLAISKVIATGDLNSAMSFIEMNLGFSFLLIPILSWLTGYFR